MDFEFVLVGSDMNAYYMARSFHEEYNRKCYMIGTRLTVFTKYSNIFNFIREPKLNEKETFINTLVEFYKEHKDKKLILASTNDVYTRLIIENSKVLKKYYLFNYTNEELMNNLMNKKLFYTIYSKYNINIPKTYIYSFDKEVLPNDLDFPVILKPSNTTEYFNNIIAGLPKIFKPESLKELKENIETIKNTTYRDTLIIQEFIPGDDSALFDSVFYFNKNGKAQFASFAQIGLQEHNKNAIGNATVLINGYNEHGSSVEIVEQLKKFLEDIKFKGLCEVDLKYDSRDKKYKVLEVNVRQGRCSYYLTAMGYNLAKAIIDDLLYSKEGKFTLINKKMALSFVPRYVVFKYISNKLFKREMKKMYREKKVAKPFAYNKDMNLKRRLLKYRLDLGYIKKYKNSEW